MTTALDNAALSELLLQAADEEEGHRRLALQRAAKDAYRWDVEVADVLAAGREPTELRSVGPWVAGLMAEWIEHPPAVPEPDETRRGFITYAQVRAALAVDPTWETTPHGDLQMHTTDTDGKLDLPDMVAAAAASGLAFAAITDHSQSLTITNGQDEERLADQGRRIDELNEVLRTGESSFRVLRSIEMDLLDGSGDMEPAALAELDLVLGAFHTELRSKEDATERYMAALRNPAVHVLAHPTTRMFERRRGLIADWPRVFAEAARLGKAVEIDATPRRQDLNVELARIALAEGVEWFSLGSDAHYAEELGNLPIGMAIAALAGIPKERVLAYRSPGDVVAWASGDASTR